MDQRDDVGALWENFLFMERLKKQMYREEYSNRYFWRTYEQKEIDLVEERGGLFRAYEFKWNKSTVSKPKKFLEAYKKSSFEVITRENYWEFLTS